MSGKFAVKVGPLGDFFWATQEEGPCRISLGSLSEEGTVVVLCDFICFTVAYDSTVEAAVRALVQAGRADLLAQVLVAEHNRRVMAASAGVSRAVAA